MPIAGQCRVVLVLVLGVLLGIGIERLISAVTVGPVAPGGSLAPMLQRVIPTVVTLRVTGQRLVPTEVKPRREGTLDRTTSAEKEVFRTGGSGVIVDASTGYILTNNHVIENAISIDVELSDGRHFPATVVGRDIGTDLAVLKVEGEKLPQIAIGDSDKTRVGDVVVAVGNPFGLEGTATLGIVSAVMRTQVGYEAFEDYLQIDAQINPGNSGGALVNVKGELIGINTVVAGGRDKNFTIGFAIPISMAKIIQAELIKHGRMRRGFTGVIVEDSRRGQESSSGIEGHSAIVTRVAPGSSAEEAAIKPGDVIVEVDRKPVRSAVEYMTRVSTVPIGGKVALMVRSGAQTRRVSLTVAAGTVEPVEKLLDQKMGGMAGLIIGDIPPGHRLFGDLRGALILRVPPASPAYEAGFEVGDVIVSLDGNRVVTTDDLVRRIEQAGLLFRVDIARNGSPAWVRISR